MPIQTLYIHIATQIFQYACHWPVTVDSPCYTMKHCDTNLRYKFMWRMEIISGNRVVMAPGYNAPFQMMRYQWQNETMVGGPPYSITFQCPVF